MTDETPGQTAWRLIRCDDPAEIAEIEADYGMTQAEAVDDFIEESCWTSAVREFVGGKGTPRDWLIALRSAYARENPRPRFCEACEVERPM